MKKYIFYLEGNHDFLDNKIDYKCYHHSEFYFTCVSGRVLASILELFLFLAHLSKDFVKNVLFFILAGMAVFLNGSFSAPLEYLLEH